MNKNNNKLKIIQINGISGLLIAIFIFCCIATGFILFPAFLCMHIWNFISIYIPQMPSMELLHGTLLWLMIAGIYLAQNINKFQIQFATDKSFEEQKMKQILDKIKETSIKEEKLEEKEETKVK